MRALVLATHNDHKLREIRRLVAGAVAVEPLPPGSEAPAETGDTYAENALIKARAAVRATGLPAIADDSGIEAEALDGRPGVRSARFAGPRAGDEANLARLIAEVPPASRLRYVCALAHVTPSGQEHVFVGEVSGRMASERRGERGFGYDPVFVPDGERRTMAELAEEEKDAISHRGEAVRRLLEWLGH